MGAMPAGTNAVDQSESLKYFPNLYLAQSEVLPPPFRRLMSPNLRLDWIISRRRSSRYFQRSVISQLQLNREPKRLIGMTPATAITTSAVACNGASGVGFRT